MCMQPQFTRRQTFALPFGRIDSVAESFHHVCVGKALKREAEL
jgi:hypothetical protein